MPPKDNKNKKPHKNPRNLRIARVKARGQYPSDEQRAAESARAKAKNQEKKAAA